MKQQQNQGFSSGVSQDQSPLIPVSGTSISSVNGRIVFNLDKDGQVPESGLTGDWTVEPGFRLVYTHPLRYSYIDSVQVGGGLLCFFGNGVNTEIGFFKIDTTAGNVLSAYERLFTDAKDPFGDTLRIPITAKMTFALDLGKDGTTTKVYFADGFNEPRVADMGMMRSEAGLPIDLSGDYPKKMSVHSMALRMDVLFPTVKFLGRTIEPNGGVLSGGYEVCIRYYSETGHYSLPSPLGMRYFVSNKSFSSNHHDRVMGVSGVQTKEGMRFRAYGIDTRWDQVQIITAHYETDGVAMITAHRKVDITGQEMEFIVKNNNGDPLPVTVFDQRFTSIERVGSMSQQEGRLFMGDIDVLPHLIAPTESISASPIYHDIAADNTELPDYSPTGPMASGPSDRPITNSQVTTREITLRRHSSASEKYPVIGDYANYHGQQYAAIMGGYFRDETYPFMVPFIDRKGNVMPGKIAISHRFPALHENRGASLTRFDPVTRRWVLRAQGVAISGIRVPVEGLRGPDGKLNISGFMVTRGQRSGRVLMQGVMLNTTRKVRGLKKSLEAVQSNTYPLSTWINKFQNNTRLGSFIYPIMERTDRSERHNIFSLVILGETRDSVRRSEVANRESTFTFHSPDLMIEETFDRNTDGDVMEMQGAVLPAYGREAVRLAELDTHFYTKNLEFSSAPLADAAGRPQPGQQNSVQDAVLVPIIELPIEKYDSNQPTLKFVPDASPFLATTGVVSPGGYGDFASQGFTHKNTLVVKTRDFPASDIHLKNRPERTAMGLYNYVVPVRERDENQPFYSTGHYQAITEETLAQAVPIYEGGRLVAYEFNDVDVFGGDCYVNFFDFTRIYPNWSNCAEKNRNFLDYSVSHIFPVESKYNTELRDGRRFAKNAVQPANYSCRGRSKFYSTGIMENAPENYAYNRSLLRERPVQFHVAEKPDAEYVASRRGTVAHTDRRAYGDIDDGMRRLRPTGFLDLEGAHGRITALQNLFGNIYCWREHAYGILRTNERATVPTDTSYALIGTGQVLDGISYISTEFGLHSPHALAADERGAYWIDAARTSFIRHSQAGRESIEDQNGVHNFITSKLSDFMAQDMGYDAVIMGMDKKNRDVILSTTAMHMFYSTLTSSFQMSEAEWQTSRYASLGRMTLSSPKDNRHQLYLHGGGVPGMYYGALHDSRLSFIVNHAPEREKFFNNGEIGVQRGASKRISSIIHRNREATTHNILPQSDDRARFTDGSLRYQIYDRGVEQRLFGKYMIVEITARNRDYLIDREPILTSIHNYVTKFIFKRHAI